MGCQAKAWRMLCEPVMANTDGLANATAPSSGVRAVQVWPWLLAGFAAAAVVALVLPLRLPLGSFYWDLVVYLDAFQRIRTGQAPALDFFAPVGPLGYYLGYAMQRVFPNAQPLLLTNWALMPVLLPLIAAILAQRGAARHASALLLPFLIFVALPINLYAFYPVPGFDGFGVYNRHAASLLYWLVATLIFVEKAGPRSVLVGLIMLMLFLTKITGALAGTVLVAYACLSGRMRWSHAVMAAAGCVAGLVLIDLPSGLIRAYLSDILTLLTLNSGTLLPRLLTVASAQFAVVFCSLVLAGYLVWDDGAGTGGNWTTRLRSLVDGHAGWLLAGLFALGLFETQNTGSLEFIGLWPVLLAILLTSRSRPRARGQIVAVLALAVSLPLALTSIGRGMRALAGTAGGVVALPLAELGPIGRVNLRRGLAERAGFMLDFYPRHQQTYADLAREGFEPSSIMQAESDYQAIWLLEVKQGLLAIQEWEQREGRQLNGFFTLDFVDPFNPLLERHAPRNVPIGITPGRNLPPLDQATLASLAQTDAILSPKCPPTPARLRLADHFGPALEGRDRVALSPCWDMFVRRR